ncbi:MAG: hypothetical protein HYY93_13335 [Planctomycetes bacterium]|nr:hypothetical protein [Planctomycetota bacterium]
METLVVSSPGLAEGAQDVEVTTSTGTGTKPGGIIIIEPGPGDVGEIVAQAKQGIYEVFDVTRAAIVARAKRGWMTINTASSTGISLETAIRARDEVLAAGGSEIEADEAISYHHDRASRLTFLVDESAADTKRVVGSWNKALNDAREPLKLPAEMIFSHEAGRAFNNSAIKLPSSLGGGEAETNLAGQLRVRFVSSGDPNVLSFSVTDFRMTGASMVAGPLSLGLVRATEDTADPTTGTLDLQTGEVVMVERHLVGTTLTSGLGFSPMQVETQTTGVLAPIAAFRKELVRGPGRAQSCPEVKGLFYGTGGVPNPNPPVATLFAGPEVVVALSLVTLVGGCSRTPPTPPNTRVFNDHQIVIQIFGFAYPPQSTPRTTVAWDADARVEALTGLPSAITILSLTATVTGVNVNGQAVTFGPGPTATVTTAGGIGQTFVRQSGTFAVAGRADGAGNFTTPGDVYTLTITATDSDGHSHSFSVTLPGQ